MLPTPAARASARSPSVKRDVDLLDRIFVLAVTLSAGAFLLPLLPVAGVAYGALRAARTRRMAIRGGVAAVCVLPGLVALLVIYLAGGGDVLAVRDAAGGYAVLQREAAVWAAAAVRSGDPFPWKSYAGRVWPYALAGGALLGLTWQVGHWFGWFGSPAIPGRDEERTGLRIRDAARLKDESVAWGVPDVVGRNVISLLSAPPGGGKGWWLWGMARAMQDGTSFFGLPANRMKLLWCTEEGASFARTRERFGVEQGLVEVLHRHEVRGWAWPELVKEIRRQAWRRKCGIVVFDTIRAWCPEAEKSPEAANAIMTRVRQELTGPGLGALFVHHDTKAGGQHGAGVSGTYGLVGAVDVLIELKRCSDDPADPRRRMVTSRRFEPLDLTAKLEGHRYVLLPDPARKTAARAAVQAAVHADVLRPAAAQACARCGRRAAEWHHPSYAPGDELAVEALCLACHQHESTNPTATIEETVRAIAAAGGAMTTPDFMAALGIAKAAASDRLTAAERAGWLAREGKGRRSGPQVWRVAGARPGVS